MSGEFSVYWWDDCGTQHEELRFVSPRRALEACARLTRGPAAPLRLVHRVIITDGGDCCCLEWKIDEGVVFGLPTEERTDGGVAQDG